MFRPRPGETAQQTGRRWESFWAKLMGVLPVKGSGSQWHAKLDVGDGSVLWSLKHTDAESFRMERKLMREAEAAVKQDGDLSTIPGVAVSVQGEAYVVLRAEDFLRIAQSDAIQYVTPSRGEQKRARARVPALLRDEDEE